MAGFFFFQAEDGIRDYKVTGVQTCALPIFRNLFRQSVRRRLRSDSPVLAELSGGLDSSSIVCMADDILATGGAETPRLDTLSIYDKTEPNGDDWIYFRKIEEKRGRPGVHIDGSKMGSSPVS